MGTIAKVLSGTGILIGIYLFLTNYKATTSIISQLGSTYTNSVKTLQGKG